MSKIPFHLQYELNRRQRLIPHMRIWMPYGPFVLILLVGSLFVVLAVKWWLFPLFLFALWFSRGFLVGLIDVVIHPKQSMDIVVEENAIGFLSGGERWFIYLDGILRIDRICEDTWTIYHHNGTVINILAAAIADDQVQHLKDAAEAGKSPEGVKAVIERGRRIQELNQEEWRKLKK